METGLVDIEWYCKLINMGNQQCPGSVCVCVCNVHVFRHGHLVSIYFQSRHLLHSVGNVG